MAQDEKTRRSGRFWLAGAPERTVGGWLDFSGRWPLLTLADPLTPSMREASRSTSSDGTPFVTMVPADDAQTNDGLVIHGMLRNPSRRVTLVGAFTSGRSEIIGGVVHDPGEQRFRAEYVLVGPHQMGADTTFTMARLRVRHLDSWANLPGISIELKEDWSQITARYEKHEQASVMVTGGGELVLGEKINLQEPTMQGAGFKRSAELLLNDPDGLTVDKWWRKFVTPMTELFTMAIGFPCPPIELKLYRDEDKEWVDVQHPQLQEDTDALLYSHQVLLSRNQLTLDHLAKWLDISADLAPIPALVTETITAHERPLPSRLLEMTIATEGLHRRLQPRAQVMTRSQKDRARRQAKEAVPEELKERVSEALMHIDAPSYIERLRYITDLTREAVPLAAGLTAPSQDEQELDTTRDWEERIKAVRNGFAHQAPRSGGTPEDAEWKEQAILLRTLYWVLTAALLLQAGVEPSRLGERIENYDLYRTLLRQARQWLPEIYMVQRKCPPPEHLAAGSIPEN
ncbi:HEPN domain-containing protein [Streptosporangium sp. CA-135522]|uniref:ApeA N-terminal domain 1-containing protein n=1 Tax=Streptosporangium sp. CA-135522 TaxID=3240072 RepID=UPI003D8DA98C